MTAITAAEKVVKAAAEKVSEKKDEKVEKRRALGRGLESLLPGPRVVPSVASGVAAASGETKIPSFAREDKREPADDKGQAADHKSGAAHESSDGSERISGGAEVHIAAVDDGRGFPGVVTLHEIGRAHV